MTPVSTHIPKVVPHGSYHRSWRTGYIQNSRRGNSEAKRLNKSWLDNDVVASSDLVPHNRHSFPELLWGRARPWTRPWSYWKDKRVVRGGREYHIRDAREMFQDAADYEQSIEAEIKRISKRCTRTEIRKVLTSLRAAAQHVFGLEEWHKRVQIKLVSTLGPRGYALDVADIAHQLGFTVIVTCRSRDRFRKRWPVSVTYVRSSAVIRRRGKRPLSI